MSYLTHVLHHQIKKYYLLILFYLYTQLKLLLNDLYINFFCFFCKKMRKTTEACLLNKINNILLFKQIPPSNFPGELVSDVASTFLT
jgi:hypothetical protein